MASVESSEPAAEAGGQDHVLGGGVDLGVGRGRVFNPLIAAEWRRWRARPFTYLFIAFVTLLGIISMRGGVGGSLPLYNILLPAIPLTYAGRMTLAAQLAQYLQILFPLVLRPSTLIPTLMVWRALVSFRNGGLYEPFRCTFITPQMFLRGIIVLPFAISWCVLCYYTLVILWPQIFLVAPPTPPPGVRIYLNPMLSAPVCILLEGAANGMLISLIALWFGIRLHARMLALAPLAGAIFLIMSAQAFLHFRWFNLILYRLYSAYPRIGQHWPRAGEDSVLLVVAAIKAVAILWLWRRLVQLLRATE